MKTLELRTLAFDVNLNWSTTGSVDWSDAESLIRYLHTVPSELLEQSSELREIIKYTDDNDEWDNGIIGNAPREILEELHHLEPVAGNQVLIVFTKEYVCYFNAGKRSEVLERGNLAAENTLIDEARNAAEANDVELLTTALYSDNLPIEEAADLQDLLKEAHIIPCAKY